MNLVRALYMLREELRRIDELIAILERLARDRQPRSTRPPKPLPKLRVVEVSAQPVSSPHQASAQPARHEVAETLRRRFDEANASYQSAPQEYARLMSIAKDTDRSSVDGNLALVQAMQVQQRAVRVYERASKDLFEFTVRGELPKDTKT